MPDYKNILVAVDFSPATDVVGKKASELAQQNNARIILVHVVEYLPPIDIAYEPITSPNWVIEEEELLQRAKESLEKFAIKIDAGNAPREVVLGIPKHEIIRIAKEQEADLIVIGPHGRHGFSRLLGSTADPVLHNAPCDVLAVRITED
jgi:universal stress protein A